MSFICVFSAPEPPKLLLSTFLLAYFPSSVFALLCPPSTPVITATTLP